MLKEKLIDLLDRDEPDYDSAARLGSESLPYLLELTKEGDERLAPRAVYTASLIQDEKAIEVLNEGASSQIADVRVAAAAAIQNQPQLGDTNTVTFLLNDADVGVRKMALKTVSKANLQNDIIRSEIKKRAAEESNEQVRTLADEVYHSIPH